MWSVRILPIKTESDLTLWLMDLVNNPRLGVNNSVGVVMAKLNIKTNTSPNLEIRTISDHQ